MIPQEVRDHPAAALDDPLFAKPEGVREYFATFDDWTFGRPDVAPEAARVGFELLEFQERRGSCPELRVLALKAKGTVYHVARPATPYAAFGVGAPIALGALYALESVPGLSLRERATMALAASEAHSAGVRGPFDFVELPTVSES